MSPIRQVVFLGLMAVAQCYPRPHPGLIEMGLNALGNILPGMVHGGMGGMGPMGMGGHGMGMGGQGMGMGMGPMGIGGMGPMGMGGMGPMGMGGMGMGGMGMGGFKDESEVVTPLDNIKPKDLANPNESLDTAIDAVQKKIEELSHRPQDVPALDGRSKRDAGTETPDQDKPIDVKNNTDSNDIEVKVSNSKDPGLSANKDYLLIPVDTVDHSLAFANRFNAEISPTTLPPIENTEIVSGKIASSMNEVPTNNYQNQVPVNENLNFNPSGQIPMGVQSNQYQNLQNPIQNQQTYLGRQDPQPLYTLVQAPLYSQEARGIPSNEYYTLSPQQNSNTPYNNVPIYNLVPNNPQNPQNNLNGNQNLYLSQNIPNQPGNSGFLPNNMVPNNMNNQQYLYPVTISNGQNNVGSQPRYLLGSQPYNNNNFVPLGNQPSNLAPVGNHPNSYAPVGQPTNWVLVNQPNNVTPLGNQPNNFAPLGNQPSNFAPLGNQPNILSPLGNQPNNHNQLGQVFNGIPILLQPSGNGVPLFSFKEKEDSADDKQ